MNLLGTEGENEGIPHRPLEENRVIPRPPLEGREGTTHALLPSDENEESHRGHRHLSEGVIKKNALLLPRGGEKSPIIPLHLPSGKDDGARNHLLNAAESAERRERRRLLRLEDDIGQARLLPLLAG